MTADCTEDFCSGSQNIYHNFERDSHEQSNYKIPARYTLILVI